MVVFLYSINHIKIVGIERGEDMAKVAKQLTELIGHTPLLELSNYEKEFGLGAKLIAKL